MHPNDKKPIALVIGRFQPFHKGHLHLIEKALEQAQKVTIAIGSSNITNEDNPLPFSTRKTLLKKLLTDKGLEKKVVKIVPSPDDEDDDVWLKLLLKNTGTFDLVVGNNDWTNDILKKKGLKVLTVPYLRRDIYQGKHIRDRFKNSQSWENRVPKGIRKEVQNALKKASSANGFNR